jgi:hypothetical protein
VTEALPEAEPAAEVCAMLPRVNMHATIAAIEYLFIVVAPFNFIRIQQNGGRLNQGLCWIQMQS